MQSAVKTTGTRTRTIRAAMSMFDKINLVTLISILRCMSSVNNQYLSKIIILILGKVHIVRLILSRQDDASYANFISSTLKFKIPPVFVQLPTSYS